MDMDVFVMDIIYLVKFHFFFIHATQINIIWYNFANYMDENIYVFSIFKFTKLAIYPSGPKTKQKIAKIHNAIFL